MRALVLHAAALLAAATAVFLLASRFLVAWDGQVVAAAPIGTDEQPASYRVLVVSADHATTILTWPAHAVTPLKVPIDPQLIAPILVDEQFPTTRKRRFQLFFLVEKPDGTHDAVPTTSPQAVALAGLVFVIGLALRNMYVSGSPIDIVPRAHELPAALEKAGQIAQPKGPRSEYGPPPPKGKRR